MLRWIILFSATTASVYSFLGLSSDPGNYSLLCDHTKTYRCNCPDKDDSTVVDCSERRLTDIPNDLKFPTLVTEVTFQKNKLTAIPNTVFMKGSKVSVLDLSHNQIEFVSAETFANLEALEILDLSHNVIWSLSLRTFDGPDQLTTLNLAYNRINDFFPDVFQHCAQLKKLILKYNPILYVKKESFSYLKSLEILDLSSTGLSTLPDELFVNNSDLKMLELSANNFLSVPSKAIRVAKNLKHLDISENPIDSIPPEAFGGLSHLAVLTITHMRLLTALERHSLSGLNSLKELYLTDNLKLIRISGRTFKKETATDDPESSEEDENQKNRHPSLEKVSLRHNALSSLPEELLDWKELQELDLRENPWQCDCHMTWMASSSVADSVKGATTCHGPSRLSGKTMAQLVESDYTCSYLTSEATVALAVIVVASFIVVLAGVSCVLYRRSLISCRRNNNSEPKYTRVTSSKDRVDLEWDHTGEPGETKA